MSLDSVKMFLSLSLAEALPCTFADCGSRLLGLINKAREICPLASAAIVTRLVTLRTSQRRAAMLP